MIWILSFLDWGMNCINCTKRNKCQHLGIIEFSFFWIRKIYVTANKIKVYLYFEKMTTTKILFCILITLSSKIVIDDFIWHAIKNYFRASNVGLIFTIWFARSITFQVLQIRLFKRKYNVQKLDLESQVKCFDHKGWSEYCTILRQVSPKLLQRNRLI